MRTRPLHHFRFDLIQSHNYETYAQRLIDNQARPVSVNTIRTTSIGLIFDVSISSTTGTLKGSLITVNSGINPY